MMIKQYSYKIYIRIVISMPREVGLSDLETAGPKCRPRRLSKKEAWCRYWIRMLSPSDDYTIGRLSCLRIGRNCRYDLLHNKVIIRHGIIAHIYRVFKTDCIAANETHFASHSTFKKYLLEFESSDACHFIVERSKVINGQKVNNS